MTTATVWTWNANVEREHPRGESMSSEGQVRNPASRSPIAMPSSPVAVSTRTPSGASAGFGPSPSRVAAPAPDSDVDAEMVLAHVGPSISIKGDLSGDEDTLVEGRVEGRIEIRGHHLTIGTHGVVTGEVLARRVTVLGRVDGDITVFERIEIAATGRVDGDIRTPSLVIREGAQFNGSCLLYTSDAADD